MSRRKEFIWLALLSRLCITYITYIALNLPIRTILDARNVCTLLSETRAHDNRPEKFLICICICIIRRRDESARKRDYGSTFQRNAFIVLIKKGKWHDWLAVMVGKNIISNVYCLMSAVLNDAKEGSINWLLTSRRRKQ